MSALRILLPISNDKCSMLPLLQLLLSLLLPCIPAQNSTSGATWVDACLLQRTVQTILSSIAIWPAGMRCVMMFLVCPLQQDITSRLLQAFLNSCMKRETCVHDMQAKRLMQETRFELWIPVHHTTQLQHWTAATDALDHVILTAAALESVLEGILSASDAAFTVIEHQQMMQVFGLRSVAPHIQCRAAESRQRGLRLQYNNAPPKHSGCCKSRPSTSPLKPLAICM